MKKGVEREIVGHRVATPKKEDIARQISTILGIESPTISNGSTVVSEMLDKIYTVLTGDDTAGPNAYSKTAGILEFLGLTYDPYWDTSEARGRTGGSTVTVRAYSRMLARLSRVPRCFVIGQADTVSMTTDERGRKCLRYDSRAGGAGALNDAGPGSLALIYSSAPHNRDPEWFHSVARIEYIDGGREGPWEAELVEYVAFQSPVESYRVEIVGRAPGASITEITWELLQSIVQAGTGERPEVEEEDVSSDPGGIGPAARLAVDFPADEVDLSGDPLPGRPDDLVIVPERLPMYVDAPLSDGAVRIPQARRSPRDREVDRIVEERAVVLATRHLAGLGWHVAADRQRDGVGYDLDLVRGNGVLHLEVKGIQGPRLEFNLTAKEWWRACTDPDFVLAGVTTVLSPGRAHVNLVGRHELVGADRVATQFRVALRRTGGASKR